MALCAARMKRRVSGSRHGGRGVPMFMGRPFGQPRHQPSVRREAPSAFIRVLYTRASDATSIQSFLGVA